MATLRLTLQNRITTLMISSSILFISVFTFIQVNNQLQNIQADNSYRINLASVIVKNNLEATLRQAPLQDVPKELNSSLKELKESNLIEEAVVYDPDGKIIGSVTNLPADQNVRYRDMNKFYELGNLTKENWFVTEIDTLNDAFYLYLALRIDPQGPITYLAKLIFRLPNIKEALAQVYQPVTLALIIIILANIVLGYLLSKTVIGPVKTLNEVTKLIAAGDLSVRTRIATHDELEELGSTFNYMTEELIKMKERAENANPLTKLPGNIVIREETEKRIRDNRKFMVIYCDLDNFKAFNDKYGIAKGDEAIKLTAEVFKEAIKQQGNPEDFLGHEGGDDFLLLTTPEKAQGIADCIIKEFNTRIRSLYSQEDLAQGYIIAHGRDNVIRHFPIMTISLAGVTNMHRAINSYGEVTNIAAEVKKKVKATEGNAFIIDKRVS